MNGIIVMIHCCFTYYSNLVVLAFSKIYQSSNSYFFLEFFFSGDIILAIIYFWRI